MNNPPPPLHSRLKQMLLGGNNLILNMNAACVHGSKQSAIANLLSKKSY